MLKFLRTLVGQKESHPHKVTKEYLAWDEKRDEMEEAIIKNNGQGQHLDNQGRYMRYYAERSLSPFMDDKDLEKLRGSCEAFALRMQGKTEVLLAFRETTTDKPVKPK